MWGNSNPNTLCSSISKRESSVNRKMCETEGFLFKMAAHPIPRMHWVCRYLWKSYFFTNLRAGWEVTAHGGKEEKIRLKERLGHNLIINPNPSWWPKTRRKLKTWSFALRSKGFKPSSDTSAFRTCNKKTCSQTFRLENQRTCILRLVRLWWSRDSS